MSTNYYLKEKECAHCGRFEQRHIGKSSIGWVFALHVYPEEDIHELEDWIPLLQKGSIINEYNDNVSLQKMIDIITSRGNVNHRTARHDCSYIGKGAYDCIVGEFCSAFWVIFSLEYLHCELEIPNE